MPIETNIDDLTDAGGREALLELIPVAASYLPDEVDRLALLDVVTMLDRAAPDWPQTVLGLPAVA